MNIKDFYTCEVELGNGKILPSSSKFNKEEVIRVNFKAHALMKPNHNILMVGMKFKKVFARAFLSMGVSGGVKTKDYVWCLVTDKMRFYLFSSTGSILVTEKDYELYI